MPAKHMTARRNIVRDTIRTDLTFTTKSDTSVVTFFTLAFCGAFAFIALASYTFSIIL